ncbi:NAD(P)-dependent oxidoreductase [Amycolatopsis sp. EV170708-02-1]|uniref:NAD(P)-dependent oxidoreductase n=1 Tax=Amycolatopsis sp. EV170708-02-1 TaxID=2919322 RepID=UPI001F0C04D2|nr:NAD(P)-dependent oxidoreductase [Amycolatopsis sp. EV170708-02-1]UMP02241.1 phosphoglycerate dehydrogenase [Amycolatopsis sp. EV170708-02-1]
MADKTTILVSTETDDLVAHELFGQIDGVEVVGYDPTTKQLDEVQRRANVFVPPYRGTNRPMALMAQMPHLRMVQITAAGTDEWVNEVPDGVVLAGARGAHAGPVSEWILSAVLAQLRQWPALVRYQDEYTWAHRRFDADTLRGKRVLIVGAGSIGMATARLLDAFGASSTLVASTARDGIHGAAELPALIGGHQVVVITAPLNEATLNLVDKSFLAAMDDGALLVNAGRGKIVDTDALVAELQAGRLRAALDVTEPEPLPEDHPLWSCTGAIISPHSARTVPGTNALCYAVAADQVKAFLAGRVPSNAATR